MRAWRHWPASDYAPCRSMWRLRLRKIWVAFQDSFVRLQTEPVSTERSIEVHLATEAQRLACVWDAAHSRD